MSQFSRIFFSPEEHRLRAGWRILLHFLLVVVAIVLLQWIMLPVLSAIALPDVINVSDPLIWTLVAVLPLATTLSVWLARHYLDKRRFVSLGWDWNRQAMADLLFGFGLAAVLMAAIFSLEWAAGWLTVEGFAWQELPLENVLLLSGAGLLIIGVAPSWSEELYYRGYLLQNLKDGLNLPIATFLSSAFFGVSHLGNLQANGFAIAFGTFLAGLFLAYGWVRTRQLWLPLGLHAGWNFFEAVAFGFPVSGFQTFSLIRQTASGPQWLTGGAFGPEAGVIMLFATLVAILSIHWWSRGRVSSKSES